MLYLSNGEKEKQRSVKRMLLDVAVISSIIALCAVGSIYASENDVAGDATLTEANFANTAQAQKAENLAKQAALQDQAVIAARKAGDTEKADALYNDAFDRYYAEIVALRAEGKGWGEIAHTLGVHPAVLGLGHSKKAGGSGNFAAASKSSKGKGRSDDLGSARGLGKGRADGQSAGHGGGQGNGYGGGNGGGHGGGNGGGNGGGHK